MIVDVIIPNQGLTITEVTVVRWLKDAGDSVALGEVLLEIETGKAVAEVESPASGRVLKQIAVAGDVVPLGQVAGQVGTEATDSTDDVQSAVEDAPVAPPGVGVDVTDAVDESASARSSASTEARSKPPMVSPRARRIASELGIDLSTVNATGGGGRHIHECDIRRAAQAQHPSPLDGVPETAKVVETLTLSNLRRITARHTTQSFRDVPHFYLSREINAERLVSLRVEMVESLTKWVEVRVSLTDFLLRALALSLRACPNVNVQWSDDGNVPHNSIDLGLAVSAAQGLVVPVLRGVDVCSLAEIARMRVDIVERARQERLRPEELEGGSFTLTNLGQTGVDQFDPVINAPQSGILAVGTLKPRPYVVDGEVRAVKTLILTLAMDHRAIDGAEAGHFLDVLAKLLESPTVLGAL